MDLADDGSIMKKKTLQTRFSAIPTLAAFLFVSAGIAMPQQRGGKDASSLLFEKCPVFAIESVELPSQESAAIASLEVHENDSVTAHQIVAKLEGKIAELEKSAAGLQAQHAAMEASDDYDIRLAEVIVEETELQADLYEEMASKGTASPSEFRQRHLATIQAKVKLTQSKAAKVKRELQSKLTQSAVVLSQYKLDRFSLRSPISGTVTRIDHRPGEWVQAGTTVLKIIRLDELRIDCFVDLDQVDPASLLNKTVKVVSKRGASETILAGRISSFDPEVSSTNKVRVHATVQNQRAGEHWLLLPGMTVSMQLQHP